MHGRLFLFAVGWLQVYIPFGLLLLAVSTLRIGSPWIWSVSAFGLWIGSFGNGALAVHSNRVLGQEKVRDVKTW